MASGRWGTISFYLSCHQWFSKRKWHPEKVLFLSSSYFALINGTDARMFCLRGDPPCLPGSYTTATFALKVFGFRPLLRKLLTSASAVGNLSSVALTSGLFQHHSSKSYEITRRNGGGNGSFL
ncbi:hypothetical protein AVEN_231386-1 [Araneus ventricosus]|uniref:Uncharacterized protein n=1 Tax=Araneus ventricosus TaxID=182803 RepID=A0A4Y2TKX3_ARAVE|nr:hypothetical protein AVEN_231386-1 [Araneus ventricosus]